MTSCVTCDPGYFIWQAGVAIYWGIIHLADSLSVWSVCWFFENLCIVQLCGHDSNHPKWNNTPFAVTPLPAFPALLALMFYLWFCDIRILETDSQFWRAEPVKSRCWHLVRPFTFLTWWKSVVEEARCVLAWQWSKGESSYPTSSSAAVLVHCSWPTWAHGRCAWFSSSTPCQILCFHAPLWSPHCLCYTVRVLGLGLPVRFYFCSVDRQSRRMSCVEESELIRSRVELRNTR